MQLIANVRRFIRTHQLIARDARVVAAVSGGSDSVALLHLLHELDAAGELRLVAAAHLNHQLRANAARDEAFTREIAGSLDVPVCVERADVAGRAEQDRRSLEDAGHLERDAFFERVRRATDADVVAVAHTRDDQAETFLLRLLRGAGLRGLAGIYPRHGAIVRPLLDCRRDDLRAYLVARGINWVEDETNADVAIPRNRVRAELIPLLEERFNPSVVDVLADESSIVRETWSWMDAAADELARTATRHDAFDIPTLKQAPSALTRVLIWRALEQGAAGRRVGFSHVQQVVDLMFMEHDGCCDVPGQRVQRIGNYLVLRKGARHSTPANTENLFRYSLSIPGEVLLERTGCVVSAESVDPVEEGPWPSPRAKLRDLRTAFVRQDRLPGPLVVRNRRPGDRFRPVGLRGQKKLQDFFVDKKIARALRDDVPLVVDATDRIVWVAGFGIDASFQVTDPAQGVLLLKMTQPYNSRGHDWEDW
jgi:tRNA(Ile)-lysidine synthase